MYLPFLTCMLVTVATESIFYLILGPQNQNFILICVLTNTITNLTLNLPLFILFQAAALKPADHQTSGGFWSYAT